MNTADTKGIDARLSDLENRMDNVVEGALLLTEVVEQLSTIVSAVAQRTEILREAHLALTDAVNIISDDWFSFKDSQKMS